MHLDQSEFNIRCEWGLKGASILAPISDVIIVVDVLSFSTAVDVATSRGAVVYPYRWSDDSVYEFAKSVGGEVADKRNRNGYRLSPTTLVNVPAGSRLIIPSPNGSEISFSAGAARAIAGSLRNSRAVAEYAMRKGENIAVIPAGERWEDGALRPCLEDWLGAGAIISWLDGSLSPEARAARSAFENASTDLLEQLTHSSSGREKLSRDEEGDLVLAAAIDASDCVPLLVDGYFSRQR